METILEVKLETSSLLFTCKNRRWDLDDRTLRLKFFNSWPWLPAGTTLNEVKTFSLRLWSRKSLALSKVRKSSFKLPYTHHPISGFLNVRIRSEAGFTQKITTTLFSSENSFCTNIKQLDFNEYHSIYNTPPFIIKTWNLRVMLERWWISREALDDE